MKQIVMMLSLIHISRNNSINVKLIAQKIAQIKSISLEEVAKATYKNTKNVFHIK